MTATPVAFFDKIRRLCIERDNEALWHLAVTHISTQPTPTAQAALAQLGKLGIELVLTWNYIRSQTNLDSAIIHAHVNTVLSSPLWAVALITPDTLPVFKTGRGVRFETLALPTKRTFVMAVLGACFYLDTLKASRILLDDLMRFYSSPEIIDTSNPKSRLLQYVQSIRRHATPTYSFVSEQGPDHDKRFIVKVNIPGTSRTALGYGTNKKAAEHDAAGSMLRLFGVHPAESAPLRPSPWADLGTLDDTGIVARRLSKQVDRGLTADHLNNGALRFVRFFAEHTGIQLPPDLAEIAVTYYVNNSSSRADLPGPRSPRECGLTVLGNRAFLYAIAAAFFRELQFSQLSAPDLSMRIGRATYTLASSHYRARLAQPWSVYIRTGKQVQRPLPESILLEAFDGSLGAAVLLNLGNLDAITYYLRDHISSDVNFATACVEDAVLRDVTNIAKSQLERLSQMCIRHNPFGEQRKYRKDRVFSVEISGPCHSQHFTSRINGDVKGRFNGVGPTKAAANKGACDKALAFICHHIVGNESAHSGVVWLDSIVDVMRNTLLLDPQEAFWLAVPFESLPFSNRNFWNAVSAAVDNPLEACTTALQAIQGNAELSELQKEKLSAFVIGRFTERTAARPIRVVEVALLGLLVKSNQRTSDQVINVLCSSLHLLKCLEHHTRRWLTTPDIVAYALSHLVTAGHPTLLVPVRMAYIELEAYLAILQQLRVSQCVSGAITLAVDAQEEVLHICGTLAEEAAVDHVPLFAATWALCETPLRGFSVARSGAGFDICIPLKNEVLVTRRGVSDENCEATSLCLQPIAGVPPEAERVLSALHEIKNRIIASPDHWTEEIRACATNLSKVAELLRAPHLERVRLEDISKIIQDAVTNASATYRTAGGMDVIHEEDYGYADIAMVGTIFRNIADNAARAAAEDQAGTWRIEGVITACEIDVDVRNTCVNVGVARSNVEDRGRCTTGMFGTGIGVSMIQRLAGKLLGTVSYEYDEREVCVPVFIPLDSARVSLVLE